MKSPSDTRHEHATQMHSTHSRAEQSRAEQSRAEQSRAEQSRAEQSRAEGKERAAAQHTTTPTRHETTPTATQQSTARAHTTTNAHTNNTATYAQQHADSAATHMLLHRVKEVRELGQDFFHPDRGRRRRHRHGQACTRRHTTHTRASRKGLRGCAQSTRPTGTAPVQATHDAAACTSRRRRMTRPCRPHAPREAFQRF
jgi:hypothetical protein